MKVGYFGINTGIYSDAESCARVARAAEDAGFESVWTGEHVVLIDPQRPPSPLPPQTRMLDQGITLAHVAAHTSRIRLGTGIVILPQRNPLILAKELASLDVLSGGRLLFGVGIGYVEGEFEAIGVPFEERGARASEYLEAIRALWTQDAPAFRGKFVSFAGIQSQPRPLQQPHPPILIGGMSPPALRRAVLHANEWYGFYLAPDAAKETLRALGEAGRRLERPRALGPLQVTITPPPGPVDRDTVRRYEDLGVHRIVLLRDWQDMVRPPEARSAALEEAVAFVERTAESLALG